MCDKLVSDYPLVLFAKVPQAGKVKTRLTPKLSFVEAAEVAKVLLIETLQLSVKHWPGKVILAVWPDINSAFIQKLQEQFGIELMVQSPGDLGEKMFNAMEQVGYPCAVMGCDVPHLAAVVLSKAYEALVKEQNCIGPTEDGGYYLLGLQSAQPELFTQQSWGGTTVLDASMKIAVEQQFKFYSLATMIDIDHYDDLVKASDSLDSLKKFIK